MRKESYDTGRIMASQPVLVLDVHASARSRRLVAPKLSTIVLVAILGSLRGYAFLTERRCSPTLNLHNMFASGCIFSIYQAAGDSLKSCTCCPLGCVSGSAR